MPKKSPHPYCVWRNGRPRFLPSPRVRAEGHEPRDLKHEDGAWFTFGETVDFARSFMRQRAAQPKPKRGRPKAGAAACYAYASSGSAIIKGWPWDERWWKPEGGRRDLVKAGALIIAEIERLDRLELAESSHD